MSNHQCADVDVDHHHHLVRNRRVVCPSSPARSIALDRHDLREMVAHVQRGGQLQHDVRQRRMLEQLGGGQRRFAAWPLVAAAEGAMRAQHDVTEDKAEDERTQKVVAEELHVRGV